MDYAKEKYDHMMERGDKRTEDWMLANSPIPILGIYLTYLCIVWLGPKFMRTRQAWNLKPILIVYNLGMQVLSFYMCYEFTMSAYLAGYSLICQPVDYSYDPLAMRMARVCWWFYFSKVIELLDTVFFILRKKNNQVSFLHVYHHSTMILNWWIAIKYVPGGQPFFMGVLNSFVHVVMYGYYGLSALGPHMQKYLWWKKYITKLQLTQFVIVLIHTAVNMYQGSHCDFPQFLNYLVFFYAISLIILFSNFFYQSYVARGKKKQQSASNGVATNGEKHEHKLYASHGVSHNGVGNGYEKLTTENGFEAINTQKPSTEANGIESSHVTYRKSQRLASKQT